jgi:hypothetical protein
MNHPISSTSSLCMAALERLEINRHDSVIAPLVRLSILRINTSCTYSSCAPWISAASLRLGSVTMRGI